MQFGVCNVCNVCSVCNVCNVCHAWISCIYVMHVCHLCHVRDVCKYVCMHVCINVSIFLCMYGFNGSDQACWNTLIFSGPWAAPLLRIITELAEPGRLKIGSPPKEVSGFGCQAKIPKGIL